MHAKALATPEHERPMLMKSLPELSLEEWLIRPAKREWNGSNGSKKNLDVRRSQSE